MGLKRIFSTFALHALLDEVTVVAFLVKVEKQEARVTQPITQVSCEKTRGRHLLVSGDVPRKEHTNSFVRVIPYVSTIMRSRVVPYRITSKNYHFTFPTK